MNRKYLTVAGISVLLGLTGCSNNSQPVATPDSSEPTAASAMVAKLSPDEAEKVVTEWLEQANALEAEFKFAEAVETWKKICSAVESVNAEDSWQVTNARLSLESAEQQAGFDQNQLNLLRQFVQKRNETQQLIAQSNILAAGQNLQWMIKAVEELYGNNSHGLGRLKLQLGQLLYGAGNYEPAELLLAQAIDINQQRLGHVHPETEANLHLLGQVNMQLGRFPQGIQYLEQSEQVSSKLWGQRHLVTASRMNDLGVAYQTNKQLDQAREKFKHTLEIRTEALGDNHFAVGETFRNLGVTYLDQNELELAAENLKKAVAIFEAVHGSQNMLTLDTRTQLATTNMLQKKYLSAESELRQVVHQFESASPDSLPLAKASFQLAVALGHQGQYHEAEPLLQRALNLQRTLLGQWHPETVRTMKTLAVLYERTKQMDKFRSISQALESFENRQ